MQKLNRSISGDVFNNDHWSQLQTNLTELMADPDEELTVFLNNNKIQCHKIVKIKTIK